jgi:menaquinone-specific isochorismate synthase
VTAGFTPRVAVRLPLDAGPALDPFALAGATGIVFQSSDRMVVGVGRTVSLDLPDGLDGIDAIHRATGALASIACDDRFDADTSGVLALGSLPFDRTGRGALFVPEVVYGVEPTGAEWVTVVAEDVDDLPTSPEGVRAWLEARAARPADPRPSVRRPAPTEAAINPRMSDASFEAMVADAVRAVRADEVAKVVVARQVDVVMGEPIDVAELLRRWHGLEPACSVFSMPTPEGQLVGASPELLVERVGARVWSRPLAGTTDRADQSHGVLPRQLLASAKDSAEHRLVIEAIRRALTPLCSELDVPARPDLVHLHTITHLGTSVRGTLARRPDGSVPSALELVAALHPTPAVGGVPRAAALALQARLEPEPRGHYAGPVGYVDARGDGCWMLGIRSMTVDGAHARLAAGVGVVEGSDPTTERVESVLKLTAAFDALAPGVAFTTTGRPPAHEAVG